MSFTKYLEAIANAQHLSAFLRKAYNALHHGTEFGDRTATQIVAKRKSTWQNNAVVRTEHTDILILVPQHDYLLVQVVLESFLHVPVAIRSRKYYYTKFHPCRFLCEVTYLPASRPITEIYGIPEYDPVQCKW